jgi:hypothetical protein
MTPTTTAARVTATGTSSRRAPVLAGALEVGGRVRTRSNEQVTADTELLAAPDYELDREQPFGACASNVGEERGRPPAVDIRLLRTSRLSNEAC